MTRVESSFGIRHSIFGKRRSSILLPLAKERLLIGKLSCAISIEPKSIRMD
jgi:hypothetical protein